jgi:hypothetical protein
VATGTFFRIDILPTFAMAQLLFLSNPLQTDMILFLFLETANTML